MVILYGIKNCDSVKKAKKWLESSGIQYNFHDFKENGIDRSNVETWLNSLGWESVVNRRSTSWKALDPEVRNKMDYDTAIEVILEYPTLIKRPVTEAEEVLLVGFKTSEYMKYLSNFGKEKNYD